MSSSRQHCIGWLILAMGFAFFLAFAYPGFLSDDSFHQLREAMAGSYTRDHPAILSFIWSGLLGLAPEATPQAPLFLFFTLLLWMGTFAIFRTKLPDRPIYAAAATVAILLFPPMLALSGNIWKDVGMVAFWAAAIALILRSGGKKWILAIAIGLITLGMSFRHNAPPAAWPLFIWIVALAWPAWKLNKRVLVGTVLLFGCFGGSMFINESLSVKNRKPFLSKYTLFDLAGISVRSGVRLMPSYNDHISLEDLERFYTPRDNVALFVGDGKHSLAFPASMHQDRETFLLWKKSIFEYPVEYTTHRIKAFAAVLGLTSQVLHPYHVGVPMIPANTMEISITQSSFRDAIKSLIDSVSQSLLFRGWIYALFHLIILFYFANSEPMVRYLSSSSWAYLLVLLPLTGAADFRYNIWNLYTALLLFFYLNAQHNWHTRLFHKLARNWTKTPAPS